MQPPSGQDHTITHYQLREVQRLLQNTRPFHQVQQGIAYTAEEVRRQEENQELHQGGGQDREANS